MNQSPRQKRLSLLLFLAALAFVLFPIDISAQPQRGRSGGAPRRPPAQKTDAASKAAAQQQEERQREKARRMEAVALLNDAAASARLFDDLFYRARVQAMVADALWVADERSARMIFRRAWEAANASDKAEREAAANASGAASITSQPLITEARDEVFLKAAARDTNLAEAFLKELTKELAEDKSNAQKQPVGRTPWHELSGIDAERLAYAFELLGQGESNSAAQLAAPLISRGTSADLVAFIIRLREQNALAADRLYKQLLIQARTDASADANSILLLSAPMISPDRLLVVDERGSLQFRPLPRNVAEPLEQPPLAQDLRQAFYQTFAHLLLRPLAPRVDAGQTQQAFALYIAIGRLLPFFEREAAQYAPELRARETALAGELDAGRRDQLAAHFDSTRTASERAGGDPLRASYEQLARATGAQERDPILIRIVRAAARHRLWDRARRAAAEIDDQDTRRAALSFIAVSQISDLARTYADDEEYDYESIIKFLNGADVPPLAHAWGFTEAALIAARHGEDARPALIILDEAERYAARVEAKTKERVAAYAIIARAAARLEEQRAWRLLSEVVRAANAVDGFTGDEFSLDILATAADDQALPAVADTFSVKSEAFRFDQIFATMTRLDMIKTVAEARTLEGRVPQAFAYIAIARAVLDNKKG
jgi:phosphotransferase system HPr-like phosphotransfer protein